MIIYNFAVWFSNELFLCGHNELVIWYHLSGWGTKWDLVLGANGVPKQDVWMKGMLD